ncbi:RNA recognition motif [Rhizoctonia solani]|uniref:RNA recognition motif n=1 Tax=Rhizoctonia solani TaxID=456999 RepID=A0A8H7MA96_9AGAM|nr:RNA recognition motif [Rhizoctonia solani]
MSAELDKSLDQIMQSRPKNRRGASRRSSAPASTSARQRYAGAAPESKRGQVPASTAGGAPAQSIAQKIMVSGLPPDVNEEQIKLNFDSQGRSKGTATVIFQKKGDANKAFSQYNNRLIDGTYVALDAVLWLPRCGHMMTMRDWVGFCTACCSCYGLDAAPSISGRALLCIGLRIDIARVPSLDSPVACLATLGQVRISYPAITPDEDRNRHGPHQGSSPPLASRVAPAPEAKQPAAAKATAGGDAKPKTGKPGRAGRGRRRKNNNERPAKSAADLDAEMEVYKATPDEATA